MRITIMTPSDNYRLPVSLLSGSRTSACVVLLCYGLFGWRRTNFFQPDRFPAPFTILRNNRAIGGLRDFKQNWTRYTPGVFELAFANPGRF